MNGIAKTVTACVLVIGNEILSGRTQDANLAFLAKELGDLGIRLMEARVIPDVPETIVGVVNEVRAKYDYVFTTGGIGPTHDDITTECVAAAFGVAVEQNPTARAALEAHYEAGQLNEARLKMANAPVGATLIDNPISAAPGFQLGNVFVLPGVPRILQAMFAGIQGRLNGGKPVRSISIATFVREGDAAARLGEIQAAFPETDIGSYPYFRQGQVGTTLVVRSADDAALEGAAEAVRGMIRDLGGEPVAEAEHR